MEKINSCKTLNLIYRQKSALGLTNKDIAELMTNVMGETVSKESVGHWFTGNSGVPIEKIGALLHSLDLKAVSADTLEISPEKLKALRLLALDGLKDDESQ